MSQHYLNRVVGVGMGLGLVLGFSSMGYASQCAPSPPVKYVLEIAIEAPDGLRNIKFQPTPSRLDIINDSFLPLYVVPRSIPETRETILLTETIKIEDRPASWDGQFWVDHQYPLRYLRLSLILILPIRTKAPRIATISGTAFLKERRFRRHKTTICA